MGNSNANTTATAADAKAKEAELKAKAEAEAKTKADADAKAEAEAKAKAEAEAKAQAAQQSQASVGTLFDLAVGFSMSGADAEKLSSARALWDQLACDEMPASLAVCMFDCALHQGEKVADRLYGKIEPMIEYPDQAETEAVVIAEFLSWRLRRYAFTASAATKMRDWSLHILRLHAFVLAEVAEDASNEG